MYDGAWRSDGGRGASRDAAGTDTGGAGAVDRGEAELARNDGAAEVAFGADGRLSHLFQSTPCRVAFPRPEPRDLPLAVFITTSGGLAGGDRVRLDAGVAAGGAAMVTTQAAEKIYRSLGAETRVDVAIAAAPGSWLEWLPQETILFDRARLRRRTEIRPAAGARILAGEMLVLGRAAHGETVRSGLLHDEIRVRRGDRLVWMDAVRVEGAFGPLVGASAGFGGSTALATAVYAADDAAERIDAARDLLGPGVGVAGVGVAGALRAGATVVNGLLVVRWLGEPFAVRRAFAAWWMGFRAEAAGLPRRLPRLWSM